MDKSTNGQIFKPLSKREKFAYGFGDLSTSVIWTMTTTWAMFFFTDIFLIPALAAGTLLLVARIFDAVNDPVVGLIVDKTDTKMGKARPYLLWFAIPYGLIGCFLFFTPNLDANGKLTYAYILYLLLVTLYTLVNIPYNSMIALMTKDQKERTQLSRNRLLFAMGGYIVVSLTPVLAKMLGSGMDELAVQRSGFFRVAIIFGIIAAAGFLITFFNTKEHVREERKSEEINYTFWQRLRAMGKNGPWVVASLMMLTTSLRTTVMTGVLIYYVKYYLGRPESFSSVILITTLIGMMTGITIGPKIIAKTGVKKAIIAATVLSTLISGLLFVAGTNAIFIIICTTLFGCVSGIPSVASYAMFGDAVEYGEWKTGIRSEGLTFSSYTLAQKAASGIGSFLIGVMLTVVGYNSELAVQAVTTSNGILLTFIGFPCAIFHTYNSDNAVSHTG